MKDFSVDASARFAAAILLVCLIALPASAQKKRAPEPGSDDVKDANGNTVYPTTPPVRRTADGHPDFSGVYYPGTPESHPDDFKINERPTTKFDRRPEKPAYQPWALEKIKRMGSIVQNENILGCPPMGAPGFFFKFNQGIQMIQSPTMLVILGEQDTTYRIIYMQPSRKHPDDVDPLFMGDAIGHWEGDALMVDTVGVDTHTWVGAGPLFASDVAHYTETFRHPNANEFTYQFTIDDPKVLMKPWTSPVARYALSRREIMENYCTNLPDVDQGMIERPKIPKTPNGSDERYFDEQEYQELSKQFNSK